MILLAFPLINNSTYLCIYSISLNAIQLLQTSVSIKRMVILNVESIL